MNISTSHTPIQSMLVPRKEGLLSDTNITVGTSLQPISEPTAHPNNGSVNPIYDKPAPNTTITPEIANEVEPSEKLIDGKSISNETSDIEQDVIVKNKSSNLENNPLNKDQIFSGAEIELISSLKLRDAEVGAHERAHSAVGGQHASSPSYSYKTGPDGVKYAISGEVSIDTSLVAGEPQATLQKAQQIKAAALAPSEPSGQDRKVAAKADQMATQARNEISESNRGREIKENRSWTGHANSVPDHLTGQKSLSTDKNMDNATEMQMHDRNFHINKRYQNIVNIIAPPNIDAQA
jgi:hypothetical protein